MTEVYTARYRPIIVYILLATLYYGLYYIVLNLYSLKLSKYKEWYGRDRSRKVVPDSESLEPSL